MEFDCSVYSWPNTNTNSREVWFEYINSITEKFTVYGDCNASSLCFYNRWRNILDPNLYLGDWRPEEDSMLLASVSEFGPCWSKIAEKIIPGRNDSMCSR